MLKIPVSLYYLECLVGVGLGYLIYRNHPVAGIWCLMSIMLVLTPEGALDYARARIFANFIGAGIGLVVFCFPPITFWSVATGVIATLAACRLLATRAVDRLALASVLVILLHPPGEHQWEVAVERAVGVCAGCLIGIGLTLAFRFVARHFGKTDGTGMASPPPFDLGGPRS